MPKELGSKSCSSKQAVGLTKSLAAPGWGCRSQAWLGSPTSEDHLLCGEGGMPGASPCPLRGRIPVSRKGLDSSWGLEDFEKSTFLLPFGISAPSRSCCSSTPDPGAPSRRFWPPEGSDSPSSIPPPATTFPCLQELLGIQDAHGLAPAQRMEHLPGAQQALQGLEAGLGWASPLPASPHPHGLLTQLRDPITFVQLQGALAIDPPEFRLGHNCHRAAPGSGTEGFCSVPKQKEEGEGPVAIPAHPFHP